jgi:hypothetical protein
MRLARSAWLHLRQNGQLPPLDDLLASIKRFTSTESWQREQGRYIPQMSNWLRGQRWLDALLPADEEKIREKEALLAHEQAEEARKARSKAESERLRPLFDAFAAKFKDLGKPYGDAMAFGTWRYLYSQHKAPSPSDVPDDNALGIVEFMNAFKRKCDEDAYSATRLARAVPTSENPRSCGEILQTSGLLQRLLPQREILCVAV